MTIKCYRPTSAGRRAGSVSMREEITLRRNAPEKTLLIRKKKTGGRALADPVEWRCRRGQGDRGFRHPSCVNRRQMSITEWCERIQNVWLSQAISQSTWGYPAVGAIHGFGPNREPDRSDRLT